MGERWQTPSPMGTVTGQSQCNRCSGEEDKCLGIPSPRLPRKVQGRGPPTLWIPKSLTAEKPDSGSRESNVLRFLIQSDQINSHHEVNLGLLTCDTTEVHNVPTCQLSCLPLLPTARNPLPP